MKKKLKRKNQPDSCKFYLSLSMRCVCQNIYAAGILYLATAYIKGLFDNVDHGWLIKFLGHDIADRNFLRLIKRFLKAGVMEEGKYIKSDVGTLQGGLISPILANIYLRYNLDLWFEKRDRRQMRGESYMIHYVDDFVCAFEYEEDARNFCNMLKERLSILNLQIAEEKTKVIEFGRFAAANRKRKGEGKPGTFDFLGFTH